MSTILLYILFFLPGPDPVPAPRNVILLIGDGMGLTQITAALYQHGDTLHMARFPVTGLVKTHSARELITDSAAGATALACGCKTRNGALGLDNEKRRCPSIVEQGRQRGLATGLIATSSLTHATPAAFVAHVDSRTKVEEIAQAFLDTQVDLLVGGGMKYFNRRADGRDLLVDFQQKGYTVKPFEPGAFAGLPAETDRPLLYFTALEEPPSMSMGRGDFLPVATRQGLAFLGKRSEKGFFLMVEGSQIDWAGHANKGHELIAEMLDFDAAVGEALRFAQADGETLVIVTADHETGGLAIDMGSTRDSMNLTFTTKHHTAALVPVFAYGPGAATFNGVMDNTEIFAKMKRLLGWD